MAEMSVYKYVVPIPTNARSFVVMPATARLLSVGLQDDEMVVWALVDPDEETGLRRLIVANTGALIPNFPPSDRFVGTVTSTAGVVWHVFDGDPGSEDHPTQISNPQTD